MEKDVKAQLLSGGGEMGELIRSKDWSSSQLGIPANWPQSLVTTLGIILHSRFPMFLFWGQESLCFYNDAYRPSLGNDGKHPAILGERAADYWGEIWPVIQPLIDQVLQKGESTWSENQLIPIFRNGHLEDVYWTFSYSPVYDETGIIAGVLVTCTETTHHVHEHRQLEESRNQLLFAIEASDIATWDLNPVTNTFTANHRLKEWFGLPPHENFRLETAFEVINPEDHEKLQQAIADALDPSRGGIIDAEFTIRHPQTGLVRILRAQGKTSFNETGMAFRLDGILQDVTRTVMARRKIEESEERLNIVIDASELATWELNLATDEVIYSGHYAELFGFTKENLPDREGVVRRIHPDDKARRQAAFEKAYETGNLYYEVRYILHSGVVRWLEAKGKVFYNRQHQPIKVLGTLRDTTERRKHEQELMESEQKFRLLADSMPQFVWTGDDAGNLNYFNQSVYRLTGMTEEEIMRDGWLQIVHSDDRAENIRLWKLSVETGRDFLFEHRFKMADGQYRWQLSRAVPTRDADGHIQMWVGTSTDIEDQKSFTSKLEVMVQQRTQELAMKNNELERMNSELDSFAYISSHDLQEPLRKIQTFSTQIMMKELDNMSDRGKDIFGRMQKAAERMQALIDDLLAYSRTSTATLNFESVGLDEIVNLVGDDLREEIALKEARIELLSSCNLRVVLFQFRQVMNNLISNSLKFSKPGKPPVITIACTYGSAGQFEEHRLKPEQNYVHIRVSDNGIGFDPIYQEKIFEVFQRLHGRHEYSGTGIGLAIVKKIMENHHAFITAKGEIDGGASFDMYIPAD